MKDTVDMHSEEEFMKRPPPEKNDGYIICKQQDWPVSKNENLYRPCVLIYTASKLLKSSLVNVQVFATKDSSTILGKRLKAP